MDRWSSRGIRRSAPALRPLVAEDLPAVVACAERALHGYAGGTVHTVEDFAWRCLDRPGTGPQGGFVVEHDGELVGYLVMRDTGEILECVVDHTPAAPAVLGEMLAAAEQHAREVGARHLVMNLPTDRRDLVRTATGAGFAGSAATNLYVRPMDLPTMLGHLTEATGSHGIDIGLTVRSDIESARVGARFHDGVVTMGGAQDAPVRMSITRDTLTRILFSRGSVGKAVVTRDLRVSPPWRIVEAVRFLRSLAVRAEWFFNRSDIL